MSSAEPDSQGSTSDTAPLSVGAGGFPLYVMTCEQRLGSAEFRRTLDSIARSDWGAEPIVHIDDAAGGDDPKSRQTENYRRILSRVAQAGSEFALILEDDVTVNRHLRANLERWEPIRQRRGFFLGPLYNPNIRELAGAPSVRDGFVADPDAFYGSQALVVTPELASHCLDHWPNIAGLQDIKVSRLAAQRDRNCIVVHAPSLVQHLGSANSTHSACGHTALDFDPWWRAAGGDTGTLAAEPSSWEGVRGWFDWPGFYRETVESLDHGVAVVEVGTFLGRSIIYLAQTMKHCRKDLRVFAVDTFVGTSSDPLVNEVVASHGGSLRPAFEQNLRACGVDDVVTVLEMESAAAAREFQDDSLDLVFIDGDHTFEGVVSDLRCWLPKLKSGGTLAGHDIDTYTTVGRGLDLVLGEGSYRVDHTQNMWIYQKPGRP